MLVFALILAGSQGMPAKQLGDVLGADVASGALRKRCQRTRKATGLPIDSQDRENQTYWVLDVSDTWVDSEEFCRLAKQLDGNDPAGTGADPGRARKLRETAEELWRTGPLAGLSLPESAQQTLDGLHQAHARVQQYGRRGLIVDAEIAQPLAKLVCVRHVCDVANTVEEFEAWRPKLGDFDLVVVADKLSGGYYDKQGEWIIQEINEVGCDVAVVMMFASQMEKAASEWMEQLLLVDLIPRPSDEPSSLSSVAKIIFTLLASESDLRNRTCNRIAARIDKLGRKEKTRLESGFPNATGNAMRKELQKDIGEILTSTSQGDAAQARRLFALFIKRWPS